MASQCRKVNFEVKIYSLSCAMFCGSVTEITIFYFRKSNFHHVSLVNSKVHALNIEDLTQVVISYEIYETSL